MPSLAAVSVVGTRFVFDEETKRLSIKLINDNEGNYLIKTTITGSHQDEFVISPPLFILPQNASNILTIVPHKLEHPEQDQLYRLSIASIPKSQSTTNNASVSFAVRSNFNLIYRHDKLKNANFEQLKLEKNNGFYLKNLSNFVFTFDVAAQKNSIKQTRMTLAPDKMLNVDKYCQTSKKCDLWISFINDDDSIIKELHISSY